jgi:hypothetical protein
MKVWIRGMDSNLPPSGYEARQRKLAAVFERGPFATPSPTGPSSMNNGQPSMLARPGLKSRFLRFRPRGLQRPLPFLVKSERQGTGQSGGVVSAGGGLAVGSPALAPPAATWARGKINAVRRAGRRPCRGSRTHSRTDRCRCWGTACRRSPCRCQTETRSRCSTPSGPAPCAGC